MFKIIVIHNQISKTELKEQKLAKFFAVFANFYSFEFCFTNLNAGFFIFHEVPSTGGVGISSYFTFFLHSRSFLYVFHTSLYFPCIIFLYLPHIISMKQYEEICGRYEGMPLLHRLWT